MYWISFKLNTNNTDKNVSGIDKIMNLRRFTSSWNDGIGSILNCFKKNSQHWKFFAEKSRINQEYQECIKRFKLELDWVSIVKSIREVRALLEASLTENQRILSQFSEENIISSINDQTDLSKENQMKYKATQLWSKIPKVNPKHSDLRNYHNFINELYSS